MGFDFNYDADTWIQFFKDNWFVLVIALVVLLIVIRVVKTVVRWLLILAIVLGIVVYSGYSLEEVKNLAANVTFDDVKELGGKIADSVKQEAINAMVGEAKEATYTANEDGTYTIKSRNLELIGTPGANEVKVSFQGAPLGTWEIDATIRTLIEQAKKNG
ncbi:hypothetical protein PAECIP111893_03427 [Paenibacillus plantiphilus]|uniref:ATPase n=1 Tax=Paenibacillus plantiphilus TaxID=2905650 RepID=A0ABN8GKU0_9BACL|nr:hypothetical protein [Paenibacillus plantiphilus]CAH1211558.1 hypothetical protein PAECIP111893_03427 [Paenibacillus plantiphilus]